MDVHSKTEYRNIKITGTVSVEPVTGSGGSWNVLIMGPTGAGKSTFIESLGWNSDEKISSNRLQGFTQTLSTYRAHNITCVNHPIHLVDSPGFVDANISEMGIVSMLKNWLKDDSGVFHYMLYLTPITHVRLPGSQRQALKTFQALAGINCSKDITIVTTMWDSISPGQAMDRAEETFNQLRNDIWKDCIEEGAKIVKFCNTKDSALSILDGVMGSGGFPLFSIERMVQHSQGLQETPLGSNIYTDLQDRIQNLRSNQANLQSELEYAVLQGDEQLHSVLLSQLEEAGITLERFQTELRDYGDLRPISQDVSESQAELYHTSSPSASISESVSGDITVPHLTANLPRENLLFTPSARPLDRTERGKLARAIHSLKCW